MWYNNTDKAKYFIERQGLPVDKYKRLFSNTLLFAVSNFSAKMLSFFLKPLYSYTISNADMGQANQIINYATLLLPVICLGMDFAVLRFGLDKTQSKTRVFTNGVVGLAGGFAVMVLLVPAVRLLPNTEGYVATLYFYLLISNGRRLCAQFVRAKDMLRLVAIDGILTSLTAVLFNVLFLVVLKVGPIGVLWATMASDFCSAVFLFWAANLRKNLRVRRYDNRLMRQMLAYALPLVPSLMCWNVIYSSDHLFVANLLENGKELDGLFYYSYSIASIMQVVASIFNEAWQLSAVTEEEGRERFFSRVFGIYQGVMFIGAAGLVLLCRPFFAVYVNDASYEAWRYSPFLTLGAVYSCLGGFLNTIYMVKKRSGLSLMTSAAGAVCNCVLNFVLILWMGVTGAALATFLSYLLIFVMRAINTRGLLRVDYSPLKLGVNTVLLVTECVLLIREAPLWWLWCSLCAAGVLALNFGNLYSMACQLLRRRHRR